MTVGLIKVNVHARVKGIHRTRRVKSATGEDLTKENGIKERKSQCVTWLMNEDNPDL